MQHRTVIHLINGQVVCGAWASLDEDDLAEVGASTLDEAIETIEGLIQSWMSGDDKWTLTTPTNNGRSIVPGYNVNYVEIQSRDHDEERR